MVKILIVEDNPGDARLIQEMLGQATGRFGFETASTLKQAVDWLASHPCDLVLLDLGLPDGDGVENIDRITKACPEVPIVVLTGRKSDELEADVLRHHAQDFITKGETDPSELYSRILLHAIERKKAESIMMRLAEDLQRTAQAKSEFVSVVSHELRSPLTVIKEGIELIADGTLGPLTPKQAEFLGVAQRNTDRLARLINDVLDYQKLDAGQMTTDIRPHNLNTLIRENMPSLESLVAQKGLALRMELDAAMPDVSFDSDKMVQVLVNLVGNAARFTETGEIVIRTNHENNVVRLSVTDTGIGIRPEDQNKLFQTFSQIKNQGVHKTGGTGLGLAICRKIMDLHRGKIGLESQWGKGSTFYVLLPIVERRR